jgi:hypothetical protein
MGNSSRDESGRDRMKHWEIIADNLSKAGWSWDVSQLWTRAGGRSLLRMRTAAMGRVTLCTLMKS